MLHHALLKLKKQSRLTYKAIAEKSHIAQSTVTKIFAGTIENPSFSTVVAILDAMGFTVNDLIPPAGQALTRDESELVHAWRRLSPAGRTHLKTVTDSLLAYEAGQPAAVTLREIPLYLLSASAGVGNYLDGDTYDYQAFPESIIPPNTKFAIRVTGDSMEPRFYAGDIVFVYPTPAVADGDIAILTINGEGYIKVFHPDGFYSLNPAYAPIHPTEYDAVRIIGKVIGVCPAKEVPCP